MDHIYNALFPSFLCNKIVEKNYKFIPHTYQTPVRLRTIYPNVSPLCLRCKAAGGWMMYIFWGCASLQQFWNVIHVFSEKILDMTYDKTPVKYLFGTDMDGKRDPTSSKRIGLISYTAKKCILLNWNKQQPPTFDLFTQLLREIICITWNS